MSAVRKKEEDRLLACAYGYFAENGQAYVITDPCPPRPWANYLYNEKLYQVEVAQNGGGGSLYNCGLLNTVYRGGRHFFARDRAAGRYWSLNGGLPRPPDGFRCVHRPGRTHFQVSAPDLATELRVFVPPDETGEIWTLTVNNLSRRTRKLSIFSYFPLEMAFPESSYEYNNNRYWQFNSAQFDEAAGAVVVRSWNHKRPGTPRHIGFLASSRKPVGWEGSAESFLGGDCPLHLARALRAGTLRNAAAFAEQPCAALQHDLELPGHQSATIHFAIGIVDRPEEVSALAGKLTAEGWIAAAFQAVLRRYAALIAENSIRTPDPALDLMANVWAKIQLERLTWCGRSNHFYNWRNHLQDGQGFLPFDPAWARKYIAMCCAAQRPDGFMVRCSIRSREIALPGLENFVNETHRDIVAWCAYAAVAQVEETGDDGWLDEIVPYRDGQAKDTILDHLIKGLRWLCQDQGPHGLPHFGDGDWNDALADAGKEGIGESNWMAQALVWALLLVAPLLRRKQRAAVADEFAAAAARLTNIINDFGWDIDRYIRGVTDRGERFGGGRDKEGRAFLLPQTWSIITGIAPAERIPAVLKCIDEKLDTPQGPVLLSPAFTRPENEFVRIAECIPGVGENGSMYCHGAMFKARADLAAGRGDRALAALRAILPLPPTHPVEESLTFPLWIPNYYHAHGYPKSRRASVIPSTGSAAWFIMNVYNHLLGVRPTLDGLRIDPCLPSGWQEVAMVRKFRNATYRITIRNPRGLQKGNITLTVDGRALSGNLVRPFDDGREHRVEALMA